MTGTCTDTCRTPCTYRPRPRPGRPCSLPSHQGAPVRAGPRARALAQLKCCLDRRPQRVDVRARALIRGRGRREVRLRVRVRVPAPRLVAVAIGLRGLVTILVLAVGLVALVALALVAVLVPRLVVGGPVRFGL